MEDRISNVVGSWNANLQDFYNQDILVNGLAMPIVVRDEGDVYYPVIVDVAGNDRYVFTDDRKDIGIYHKLLTKTYQPNPKASFGDNTVQTVTADMMLVCWGFMDKYPKAHEVENRIGLLAPKGVSVKMSNFDRFNVFHQEFGNIPFFLTQKEFLFSIKYQISYQLNKNCIK